MNDENKSLKEELQNYETQKHADKNCLKAMQELVDSLTQNKLSSATAISELQSKVLKLESAIKVLTEENVKYSQYEIENESLKRQIKRLTDENDEVLRDFESMEKKFENVSKISLEHQKGLLLLEKSSENLETENVKLKSNMQKMNEKYDELKSLYDLKEQELKSQQIIQKELKSNENSEYKKLEKEYKELQDKKVKSDERLMLFKTKLKDFSLKLKQLKTTRENLVEIVHEYSATLPKWQLELSNISKIYVDKVTVYENRITELEHEITQMKNEEDDNSGKFFYYICSFLPSRILLLFYSKFQICYVLYASRYIIDIHEL